MKYIRLTIIDTLSFWDDYLSDYVFNRSNAKTMIQWYRLPDSWLQEGKLTSAEREQIFAYLYGADWRQGNGDGSKYVVLKAEEYQLSAQEIVDRIWMTTNQSCYVVHDDAKIERVNKDVF